MSRRRTDPPPRPSAPSRVARNPAPRPAPAAPPAATAGWPAHLLALASVALLAAVLYWPSLDGDFVFDDPNAVSQSTLIRSLTPIATFLALSTRPLTDYSFAINYALGGLETRSFHVTGVVLHVLTAALLYALAWLTLGLPSLAARYGGSRRAIAWAAAVLFTVHPLASETVAYISSRSEALAAAGYLLTMVAYVRAATRGRAWPWVILTVFATVAGAASKETAFTLLAVLPLYDWLLLANRDWRRVRWRLIAAPAAPLLFVGFVLMIRALGGGMSLGDYAATAGFGFDRWGPGQYLATQFGVIAHYLRLTVLPIGQTFDYDWALATVAAPLGWLVPLLLLLALGVGAWRLRLTQPLATFTAGWVVLTLAPTSSIMPIADLAVERRMYLPLVFLALLAAAWLHDACAALPAEWRQRGAWLPYAGAVALLLVALAPATWQRAALWGDAIALHHDGVAKAPDNPRMRLNLGVTMLNKGDPEGAYQTLVEAKRLYDRGESVHAFPRIGAFIHYNLGAVLFARKQYDEAEPQLERSLELGGQYLALRPMAKMLLSRASAQRGDWPQAIERLEEALKYQDNPDWRVDLAQLQLRAGKTVGARLVLDATLKQYPGFARARDMLAQMDVEARAAAAGQ
jgi:tetratricopeptide (TPR) repeat protein